MYTKGVDGIKAKTIFEATYDQSEKDSMSHESSISQSVNNTINMIGKCSAVTFTLYMYMSKSFYRWVFMGIHYES